MKGKLLAVAKAVLIALVILSGAIALPILFRPFYWWHIRPLDIPSYVGLSVSHIKQAYGEMMDYCMGLSNTFSVGILPFSDSGAAHFADVRNLFILDLAVLAAAGIVLAVLCVIDRKKPVCLAGHTPGFWSAIGLGTGFLAVGGLVAIDFEKAFTVFHKIFFPGKDNWAFDIYDDPVINMLPAEFFANCALLIFAVILLSCIGLLIYDRKKK
ncbi:MAG: TIGR01906 family membrane protein [Oscillospiraceae bacterium]|nr:TIGR01906 family membrane protein [Oscillospiraceae bacterium]